MNVDAENYDVDKTVSEEELKNEFGEDLNNDKDAQEYSSNKSAKKENKSVEVTKPSESKAFYSPDSNDSDEERLGIAAISLEKKERQQKKKEKEDSKKDDLENSIDDDAKK